MQSIIVLAAALALPQAPPVIPGLGNSGSRSVSVAACSGDCQCCESCDCGCNARTIKNPLTVRPTRELIVIGTSWCPACQVVKSHLPVNDVRYLNLNRDRAEIIRLYGDVPPSIPAYITVVNGEAVKRWYGSTDAAGLIYMRDWNK